MKKILVAGDFLKGSGVTTFIMNTFGQMDAKKNQFTAVILSGSKDYTNELRSMGWNYVVLPPANRHLIGHLLGWWRIFKDNEHYDAVHINYSASWNFIPIWLCKHFGIKTVTLHAHNTFFGTAGNKTVTKILNIVQNFSKHFILSHIVTNYIAVSDGAAEWMFPTKIYRTKAYDILKNGIDTDQLRFSISARNEIRQELGIESSTKVYLQVGVFQPRKNQKFSVEVFEKVFKRDQNSVLLFAGDGPDMEIIQKLVMEKRLTEHVKFLGIRSDIDKLYSCADVLLMPSLHEGLSFVVIEAQANGLDIMVSDSVPLGDYVENVVHPVSLDNIENWLKIIFSIQDKDRVSINREVYKLGYNRKTTQEFLENLYNL